VIAVPALSERACPAPRPRQLAVVDTNVWLDIFHFRDGESQPLAAALDSPHWLAVRCQQTDAELAAVLGREQFSSSPAQREGLADRLRAWQAQTLQFALREQAPCRCRDPHDQKFLDLAFAAQAAVLLTNDKALLALKRKALRFGLAILTPREFTARCGCTDFPLSRGAG
jgi:putative PIN family toxin of toxin-antitoxin system